MDKIRLSVIIPCYNVEKYLSACLNAVYAQDIPETEYEVICVNDCSEDNTLNIILEYQRIHENLRLINNEKNIMLGASRNAGLEEARGEYVWFIDSDDYIEKNVMSKLLSVCDDNRLEILNFNARRLTDEGITKEYAHFPIETEVISGIAYLRDKTVHYQKKSVESWKRIFRRSFIIEHELRHEEGVYFEDVMHTMKALLVCKRFKYIKDVIYYYRIHSGSIMETVNFSGLKLAHRTNISAECIHFVDKLSPAEYRDIIDTYALFLNRSPMLILYLPNKERAIYYDQLKDIHQRTLRKYLNRRACLFYGNPSLIKAASNIVMPEVKALRNIKKKVFSFLF
jgi:glycosyltransferase involved in cell wall biosynthesis